jgi:hypothetical protein
MSPLSICRSSSSSNRGAEDENSRMERQDIARRPQSRLGCATPCQEVITGKFETRERRFCADSSLSQGNRRM